MTKKHLAYLLATTLLAAPAAAQTSGSPSPDSAPPSTSMNNQPAAGSADVNRALAAPGPNQIMASDIRGTRVYSATNESVGDISDILLSQDGDIVALVVGVGGFLGIGQKDVAIPFPAFEFVTEGQPVASRTSTTSTTTTTTSPPASPSATAPNATSSPSAASAPTPSPDSSLNALGAPPGASGLSGTTGGASRSADSSPTSGSDTMASPSEPATTGSTRGATSTTTSSQQSAGLLKPERIVLRGMTKADLEAAPEFKRTAATSGSGTNR